MSRTTTTVSSAQPQPPAFQPPFSPSDDSDSAEGVVEVNFVEEDDALQVTPGMSNVTTTTDAFDTTSRITTDSPDSSQDFD